MGMPIEIISAINYLLKDLLQCIRHATETRVINFDPTAYVAIDKGSHDLNLIRLKYTPISINQKQCVKKIKMMNWKVRFTDDTVPKPD